MKKIIISMIVIFMLVIGSQSYSFAQDNGASTVTNTTIAGEYVPSSQEGFVRFVAMDGAVQIIAQENNSAFVVVQCEEILPTNSRAHHRVLLNDGRMQLVNANELVNLCGEVTTVDENTLANNIVDCRQISDYVPTIDPDYYRVILTDETTMVIHKGMLPSCTILV